MAYSLSQDSEKKNHPSSVQIKPWKIAQQQSMKVQNFTQMQCTKYPKEKHVLLCIKIQDVSNLRYTCLELSMKVGGQFPLKKHTELLTSKYIQKEIVS